MEVIKMHVIQGYKISDKHLPLRNLLFTGFHLNLFSLNQLVIWLDQAERVNYKIKKNATLRLLRKYYVVKFI